jgi:hypothetical protein
MIDLLLNLRIISKIPENGKINRCENGLFSITTKNSYMDKIIRFVSGDNRSNNVKEICQLIDLVIYTVSELFNSKFYDEEIYPVAYKDRKEKIMNYYTAMNMSLNGMDNLKNTYKNDEVTSSKIDLIVEKIKIFLKNYSDIF